MIYKYEKACKDAGMPEEQIAEIRRMFDAEYKRMKYQKEARIESGIGYFTIEQLAEAAGDDYCGFDIADEMNLEEDFIHSLDMERMLCILNTFPDEDREFLLTVYEGTHGNQTKLANDMGISLSALKWRKKSLLEKLRREFFADNYE